jgi:3-oxoacyl-[acyl-carrier protein] reductase
MSDKPVAMVTGASPGNGREIALALASQGHPVAVNYRSDEQGAKKTLEAIHAGGGEGLCVQADVSVPADVSRLFDDVEEALGPVGVLVNNAGMRKDGLAVRMSDEDFDAVVRTNLTGAFSCSKRALRPMLKARNGRIVNVASVAGLKGSPGQANYAAAKAGLIGLTKTLAAEVAARNITVNAVAPGPVETELTAGLSEKAWDALIEAVPQKRAATAAEVAAAVAYLCSDAAAHVTGTVLVIDGGMTA